MPIAAAVRETLPSCARKRCEQEAALEVRRLRVAWPRRTAARRARRCGRALRAAGRRQDRRSPRSIVAPGREHGGLLDDVAELANVAGPGVAASARERGASIAFVGRPSRSARRTARQRRERRYVLRALAQRWQHDLDHAQPVVEVLAEAPRLHLVLEVAVGRGDDAHVDCDRRRAADALERCVLAARAAASPASRSGMSPISSRKSVPPAAASKRPTRRASAPVNAPFSWPKSSLSTSSRADRRAVHRDERARSRAGCASWSACATSSLPVPLSPRTSTREIGRPRPSAIGLERPCASPARCRSARRCPCSRCDPLEQEPVLALEPRALERARDDDAQLVVVERLGHVVARRPPSSPRPRPSRCRAR